MIRKKPAFTLIELMVSLLIASFLVMTLTLILQQTGKAREFVDIVVANGLLRTTLFEELAYDFSGMIVEKPIPKKEGEKIEQKSLPPIQIKKTAEGMIEEFSFLTTNARAYKTHHKIMRVRYKLNLVDKEKKGYSITRFVGERSKNDQTEQYGVSFLDTIIAFDIAYIQSQKIDQKGDKKETPFIAVREWPVKKATEAPETKTVKTTEQKEEKKGAENKQEVWVTHVQITINYIKNRKGTPDSVTVFLPLYNITEVPDVVESKQEQEKQPAEQQQKSEKRKEESDVVPNPSPFSQNTFQDSMTHEDLVMLEDRTTKMIQSIFKLSKV